jgi:hypothetical protein
VNVAAHDGSAWAHAIVAPVPTTPVRSARAALALDPDLGVSPEEPVTSVPAELLEVEEPERITVPALRLPYGGARDEAAIDDVMHALARNSELLPTLAGLESVGELAELVHGWQRRRGLAELKRAIRDPAVETAELRRLLRREHWIFGGHVVQWPADRTLPGEMIPLIQFDGTLHLISVEAPRVPDLVSGTDGQFSLSPLVAAAGDRARAMIRLAESDRDAIEAQIGLAYGRTLVTIVIGHPEFVAELDSGRIRDEIHAVNTLSTGITVMTYEELVTIAERTSHPVPDQHDASVSQRT